MPCGNTAGSSTRPTQINSLSLPPESQAIHLLESFFAYFGVMFPFIHKNHIMSTYKQARHQLFVAVRRSFLALLNAIFAMATHENVRQQPSALPQQDMPESDIFFQRAELLLSAVQTRAHNLETGTFHHAAQTSPRL